MNCIIYDMWLIKCEKEKISIINIQANIKYMKEIVSSSFLISKDELILELFLNNYLY